MSVLTGDISTVRSHLGECRITVPYGIDLTGGILFRVWLEDAQGKVHLLRLRVDSFSVQQLALAALRSRGKQAKGGPVRLFVLQAEATSEDLAAARPTDE